MKKQTRKIKKIAPQKNNTTEREKLLCILSSHLGLMLVLNHSFIQNKAIILK